jgi:putative addiction module component (TIGR02574 family)
MQTLLEKMEQDIQKLSNQERAYLADRLLSSLEQEAFTDVDKAWIAEAERRYREYREGKRQGIDAKEVLEEADRDAFC